MSNTENRRASVPGDPERLLLFCPQLLIEGEDATGYNELLAQICAGVMPEGPIEELLTADVVFLHWEILRWRRAKWNTMQACVRSALRAFLDRELPFEMCSEYVAEVAEIFQDNLPEDEADTAQTLAQACARREWYAIHKLNEILIDTGRSSDRLDSLDRKARKPREERIQELMQGYVQHEPDTVKLVNELLTDAGKSMDDFIAEALAKELDKTERVDRVITLTEDRRNASLREIERRRAALGERLRRSMQQIEHDQLPAIETMPAANFKRFLLKNELMAAAEELDRPSTLEGPGILSEEARQLLAMDRYERRALSQRKFAIRAFDAARRRSSDDCNN